MDDFIDDIYVPGEVFTSDKYMNLSSSGKALLFAIWACSDEWGQGQVGKVRISQEEMRQRTKLCLKTIVTTIKELVNAGLIWSCGGERSTYGLATKDADTRWGALTLGQKRLIVIIKSDTGCPEAGRTKGHDKHLDELKWALAEQDCRCYVCAVGNGLVLHHLTYERYGAELLDDCVLLCERCHGEVNKV